MATYYVRTTGNDANAGTSAGAAWKTLGKALGASGATGGDTVWVGAGHYRETVSVGASPASTLSINGDVDGLNTGDAGEVLWSPHTSGDFAAPSGLPLRFNSKNYLAFSDIRFIGGSNNPACVSIQSGCHDFSFTRCEFVEGAGNLGLVALSVAANTACNGTFDRCTWALQQANGLEVTAATSGTADYDIGLTVKNCVAFGLVAGGLSAAWGAATSGALAFKPGGFTLQHCYAMTSSNGFRINSSSWSTSITAAVYNCLFMCSTGILSGAAGQIVEDYNFFKCGTARSNVTAGANSQGNQSWPLTHLEWFTWINTGRPPVPPFMPRVGSGLLGWGQQSGMPTTDFGGRTRPAGTTTILYSGTATAGAAGTITDGGASFPNLVGKFVRLTGGTGSGQVKPITSNTATVLTVAGNWATTPDNTTTYVIQPGPYAMTGKATAGAATTMTDGGAAWGTNLLGGMTLEITGGTGSGQTRTISSNTATVITVSSAWGTNPDNTSTYSIYRTSLTAVLGSVGPFERWDTAERETGTTDSGGVGGVIVGPGHQQFDVPVDATSTTITIKLRYDSNHGGTTKPTFQVLANGEIGVSASTATMTAAANTWETLTLGPFTPTATGYVSVRVTSVPDSIIGKCFLDTAAVS